MIRQFSAGVVVYHKVHHGVEYLLLHYGSGHWGFSKGKIEKGETKQEAALRELYEEAGLRGVAIMEGFEESHAYYFKENRTSARQSQRSLLIA